MAAFGFNSISEQAIDALRNLLVQVQPREDANMVDVQMPDDTVVWKLEEDQYVYLVRRELVLVMNTHTHKRIDTSGTESTITSRLDIVGDPDLETRLRDQMMNMAPYTERPLI